MKNTVTPQLEQAIDTTIELLSSMNETDLNKVPFSGSWTAAQVGRHLYKSQKGTDAMLLQPMPESERDPAERITNYKDILLDYERKMNSPEFILPEDITYNKEQLISSLREIKKEVLPVINTVNLNETAPLQAENPLQGSTKLEIVYFILYHTQRHNHQIEKIKAQL